MAIFMAISSPVASIFADPKVVVIKPEKLQQLAHFLEMSSADLNALLTRENRRFVYLKRQIVPDTAEKIMQLKIKGIYLTSESKRYYPEGEFAAHVLGFTDINDEGQEGVERGWEQTLAGELGRRRVIKDNKGQIIDEDVESIRSPKPGKDLVLSIDRRIQYRAHAELNKPFWLTGQKPAASWFWMRRQGKYWRLPIGLPITQTEDQPSIMKGSAIER